jgi:lipoprotein-anchoring transpeptidase ErfK/SrfK
VLRRTAAPVAAVACACAAGALLLAAGDGAEAPPRPRAERLPPRAAPRAAPKPQFGQGRPVAAQLHRRTLLRAQPRGRVVRALGTRTGFGSARVLAVVAQRGRWLGVLSQHMPNSRAGWIPADSATLLWEPYTLHVDLSARRLVVRRNGRAVRRVTVAVGRPGSSTPTGRFAVTDLLRIDAGSPYGCCALALSGRQPDVPQGWGGGDRLAIHGTQNESTLGTAASSGCLRAGDRDMRWLLRRIPLGAPVRIRA